MKNLFLLRKSSICGALLIFCYIIAPTTSIAQSTGLNFSEDELAVWRERAGLTVGKTMYKSFSDVSPNSPGDWDRILANALTAVENSANDRFTNYDVTQGLDRPITELSSAWVSNRTTQVDDKEPRPGIRRKDYGAVSIMDAGLVYQMIGGDNGNISGRSGRDFANAVKTEMLWYADNRWLDFTNRGRWSLSKPFYDRNPGFFIACWLNTIVSAYDYTKDSGVYTQAEKQKIEQWLYNASAFYYDMYTKLMHIIFPNYSNNDYSFVPTGNWMDRSRGHAWSNSPYIGYGINESFSNRSSTIWRFIMRASLLLKENSALEANARKQIQAAHRWIKEWMVFGTFSDGTFADFHRGSAGEPQKGLFYSSIAIASMIDAADSYERVMSDEIGFESLYDWELVPGTAEYRKYFADGTKGRPWRKSIELTEPKGLKKIIVTFLKYFDGSYGNSRKWGPYNIDGHSSPSNYQIYVDTDRWMSLANIYYQDDYIKSVYLRNGIRGYTRNPTPSGSYDINIGSWGAHSGTLFMYGQMEGLVWPYEDNKTTQQITFPDIADRFVSDNAFELSATSSSGLPVSFEVVSGAAFITGNIINFTSPGEITVRAYQSGNETYRGTAVTQKFTVKKKIIINSIDNQIVKGGNTLEVDVSLNYLGNDPSLLSITATSLNQSILSDANITTSGNGLEWKVIIQVPADVEGNVALEINAQDGTANADKVTFNVLTGEFQSSSLRADAGLVSGETVFDSKTFVPLLPYLVEGEALNSTLVSPIANTEFDDLYHSETWGKTPVTKYVFPVNQGEYSIHLHFADWHYEKAGDRVMDILLENEIVLDDIDVINEVGKSAAVIKSFDMVVMDGSLELEIRNLSGFSQIAAIEILPLGIPPLSIEKPDALNQVINFRSLGTVTIVDSPITLNASSSSGLPVQFELVSGDASLNGNKLEVDQLGVVTVKASQAGDETYLPADDVIRTFRVTEKIEMPELSDRIITQNTTLGPIALNISYSGDISNLNIVAKSENTTLIPDENIILKREGDDFSLTITPISDLVGLSNITIEVSDNSFASVSKSFNILVEESIGTVTALRLDAGLVSGESSFEGKSFEPLLPYLKEGTANSDVTFWVEEVFNTENDALYLRETWWPADSTVNFAFPITPGEYTVHLHFIDNYNTQVGEKLLDVTLQGVKVLNNYDVVLEAGNELAVIKSFDVTLAKGDLLLSMFSEVGYNQISGIEILPRGELPLKITTPIDAINNIPVISDIDEPLIQEGATAEVEVKATDADNDKVTLSIEDLPTFASFADLGDGKGKITVSPGFEDAGIFTPVLIANDNRGGESRLEFNIEVVDLPVELKITSFILVNADTEEEIGPLHNGDTIKYAEIGTSNINIKAEVDESVIDRVDFSINEINTTAESQPFNLFDANSSNLKSFSVIGGDGIHRLEATPIKMLSPGSAGEERSIKGDKVTIDFYLDTTIPDFELDIYPNPSEEVFNLKLNRWSEKGMFLALYDVSGKVYREEKLDLTNRNNLTLWLNDAQYKAGVYLLKVFSGDGSISTVKRIMKSTR